MNTKNAERITRHFYLIVLSLILFSFPVLAQQTQNLTGKVIDSKDHKPIVGANVAVNGVSASTQTNISGEFQLSVKQKLPLSLVISLIGYETQIVDVYEVEPLTISLPLDLNKLHEVVVIGYSEKEHKELTSSVTKIGSADLPPVPVASISQQIQGKAAGLQVSSSSGSPGSGVFLRIRGTTSINAGNDPLYVVDGVFLNENRTLQSIANSGNTTNPLADINPSDIESVEILKDADATAIYGARAANGVIIITTKRGKFNSKTKVNIGTFIGYAEAPRLWNVASGPEHAILQNEQWTNDNGTSYGGTYATRPYRAVSEGGRGLPEDQKTYDRLGDVFRKGIQRNHNVSVSGGDAKTAFYLGGDYTENESILKKEGLERTSGKINLDHSFSKNLKIGASVSYAKTYRDIDRTGDNPKGLLQASLCTPTNQPVYKADGTYATYGIFDNYKAILDNLESNATSYRLIGNFYAQYTILPNLKFKTSWSLDNQDYFENYYANANLIEGQPSGKATRATTLNHTWINEQLLTYNKEIAPKHNLGVLLGNTLQYTDFKLYSLTATGFPSTAWESASSSSTQTATQKNSSNGLKSFFGRIDYNYDQKYILNVNLRADASSRFGTGNRWGYFPSVGLAWRVDREKFLENVKLINELKIRATYGVVGNQSGIPDFGSLQLWQAGQNYLDNAGVAPYQLANPDLKWETTKQQNLGVDLGLLKNRIAIEFNYYYKYTTGLLLNVPVPVKSGYSTILKNEGEMSNKGFELTVNTVNVSTKGFKWTTTFNISQNKNRIEKLPTAFAQYNRDWVRLEQGQPMYSFWLYKQLYVDPQTGNAVYDDSRTKDGKITTNDRQIVGNAWPKFFGGFGNTFSYKGLDLNIFFNYSYGNKVLNLNRFFMEHGGNRDDGNYITWSYDKNQLKRWQKPGDITDVPRLTKTTNADGSQNYNFQTSRLLEDGSFLRLSNVTLGYTLPYNLTSQFKISSVRIYATGTNLYLWKKYLGPDPESNVASDISGATVQGLDFANAPLARTFQVGINLTF